MKKIYILAFIIILSASLLSCSKDSLGVEDNVRITKENNNALNIKAGDVFKYLRFNAFIVQDSLSVVDFTGDTLVVIISAEINGTFYVKEELHNGGQKNDVESTFDSAGYFYTMKSYRDSLIIESSDGRMLRSSLFDSSYTRIALPLADFKVNPLKVIDWRTSLPMTAENKTGFIENFVQLGKMYPRLNVVAFDEIMAVDGLGITIIYSKEFGIVRVSIYGGDRMHYSPDGVGWYRI